MGLDVYLYSRAEGAANKAHSDGWDAVYEEYYDDGKLKPGLTEEMWEAARKEVPPYRGTADAPSERYPDHFFKKNYLRSSYNGGGFNRAVPDMVNDQTATLYGLFEPVIGERDEPYETEMDAAFIPKLEEVKAGALALAEKLRDGDPLRVMHVSAPFLGDKEGQWDHLPTEDEVLAWYRDEAAKREQQIALAREKGEEPGEEYGYMNAKGEVFGFKKGLEILAITVGSNSLANFSAQFPPNTVGGQIGQLPQAVVVYRQNDEGRESYVQSAEIIGEFCDYAIELIKQDGSCTMHWSG